MTAEEETYAAKAKNLQALANVRWQESGSGYDRYGEEKLLISL